MFGNVNVDYKPCKSTVQLQRAADYILGRQPEQIRSGVVKTAPNLYWSMNCDRDNFARDVMLTRNLFGKKKSGNANLAFKMSISFSPEDNDRLTYNEVFKIAKEFAEKFFQGYEVLFAVHTDKPHKHVHFLVGNCHTETGRAFRRNQKDLYDMCEFFGEQCQQKGLTHSVREEFYNHDMKESHDKEKIGEQRMKAKGKETFKDELREVIQIELADSSNRTLEDVVNALMKHYNVECRVKGSTISYRHPNFTDKSGNLASVRGSKLGEKYTVKGIEHELTKKRGRSADRDHTGESVLHKGEAAQRGGTAEKAEQQSTYIAGAAVGVRSRGSSDTNTSTGTGQHQGKSGQTSGAVGSEHSGIQERREGTSYGSGGSGDVPTFDELFREYEQRNGTSERKRKTKSESARTVRKKRRNNDTPGGR